jgi:serpin B
LWINKSITIKPDYINVAQQYYDALVSNVEFPKDESVIDSWVEEKTNNKIKDLVKDKTGKDTAMVIVNAIYFNGSWQIQFESENTRDKDFKIDATNTVTVPMMNAHSYFDHTYMDGTDIISLPYKNNTASMIILLPRDDSDEGMTLLEQNISIEKLNEWNDNLRSTDIILYLPKFKIEKTYELSNIMKDMGIHQAFDKKKSNLTGIFDSGVPWDRLYVSDAIHKSFVDVNEEGTEAAAATAIVVSRTTSAPPQPPPPLIINVDHPFIFFIQDNETGIITFMGKIVDPTK